MEETFHGAWVKDVSAGGCLNHESWRLNTQYFFTTSSPCTLSITLKLTSAVVPMGCYIFKSCESGRAIVSEEVHELMLSKTPFSRREAVSLQLDLESSELPYVIMPTTFSPGEEATFDLTIKSNSPATVEDSTSDSRRWESTSFTGKWTDETAGGCRNFPTFYNNPQYKIVLKERTLLCALVKQKNEDFDTIGATLMRMEDEDSGKDSKLVSSTPSSIVGRSKFASPTEAWLKAVTLDAGCYVLVPSTFDPKQVSAFEVEILSNVPVTATTLGEKSAIVFQGEWKGPSAGGCTNFSTWRQCPQYFVHAPKGANIKVVLRTPTVQTMGFYLLTSAPGGKRRMKLTREAMVDRSGYFIGKQVVKDVSLAPSDDPYVFLCCAFHPGAESPYTLSFYDADDCTISVANNESDGLRMFEQHGAWEGRSAGGCMDNETWRKNPQYRLTVTETQEVTLVLAQDHSTDSPHASPRTDASPRTSKWKSIGLYVFRANPTSSRVYKNTAPVVAKANFRKQNEVNLCFTANPDEEYVIMPSMYRPNIDHSFLLQAYSYGNLTLDHIPQLRKDLLCEGEWKDKSAGGCINNPSWIENPHFSLNSSVPVTVGLLLVQEPSKPISDSIGFYMTKSNECGFPLVGKGDLLAKSEFNEPQASVYLELQLKPEDGPFIVSPCTFEPGVEHPFYLELFCNDDTTESIEFEEIDHSEYYECLRIAEEQERERLRLEEEAKLQAEREREIQERIDREKEILEKERQKIEAEKERKEQELVKARLEAEREREQLERDKEKISRELEEKEKLLQKSMELKPTLASEDQVVEKKVVEKEIIIVEKIVYMFKCPHCNELVKPEEAKGRKVSPDMLEEKHNNDTKKTPVVAPSAPCAPPIAPSAPSAPAAQPIKTSSPGRKSPLFNDLSSVKLRMTPARVQEKSKREQMLEAIKKGMKLKNSQDRILAPKPVSGPEWVVPFDVEKIVSRRAAMELSDEEADDYDEEEWM